MKRSVYPWLNTLICLGLAIFLIGFSWLPHNLPKPASRHWKPPAIAEVRGVWLTNVASAVLFGPGSINRAINQLSQLHFNTLYPVVWNRGYTFYPSGLAQQFIGRREEPFLTLMRGGSDVLSTIVAESHRRGMRVIPWFEYGLIVPANSPLATRHPDWLTQNRQGQIHLLKDKTDEEFLTQQRKQANPFARWMLSNHRQRVSQLAWLNPFHPQVQQFLKGLMLEVMVNYNVDGIQLDDHFGLPVEMGYDPLTVALYQQDHSGHKPPNNPRDPEWMRWRAAQITALMKDIVASVKTVKAQAKISLSPNSHDFSYQNYLQDWKTWVKQGLVDELVLQVYRNDLKSFQAELGQSAVEFARQKIPVSVGILTGTWNRPVSVQQIQQQVKAVRDRHLNGVSFFYWESLWGYLSPESPQQRRQVFRTLFETPKAKL